MKNSLLLAPTLLAFLFCSGCARAQVPVVNSWLGNSYGFKDRKYIQQNIHALWVRSDGTVFSQSNYDEGHKSSGIYKDGEPVGQLEGVVQGGGMAITGDEKHIFAVVARQIRRYNHQGKLAAYRDKKDRWAVNDDVKVSTIRGLALWQNELFAANALDQTIYVYDKTNRALLRSFAVPNVGRIAVSPSGDLWAVTREANAKLLRFSRQGQHLASHQLAAGFNPTGLTFDRQNRLLVCDNGPEQNIKIFDAATGKISATFGEKGGVFAPPRGQVGPLRFNGPVDVGVDGAGHIYVAQNRFGLDASSQAHTFGTILEAYQPDGARLWHVHGLEFVDLAVPDAASENGDALDVYSKFSRYRLDLSKREPGNEATYAAHLLDPFRFPTDPRLLRQPQNTDFTLAGWVRTLGGRKFLFNTSMYADFLEVYRFDAANGEIAIPAAAMTHGTTSKEPQTLRGVWKEAPAGRWQWNDKSGDGAAQKDEFSIDSGAHAGRKSWAWWIDESGDLWQAPDGRFIERVPFAGLDARGVPSWDFSRAVSEPAPAPFNAPGAGVRRIEYDSQSGTMFLFGREKGYGQNFNPKLAGTWMARYDGWKTGNRQAKWDAALPYIGENRSYHTAGVSVAGDFVFAVGEGLFSNGKESFVRVFRAGDGGYVGEIRPGEETGKTSGAHDVTYGIRAFARKNGEYLLFVEEDWRAKVMMYRWTPSRNAPAAPRLSLRAGNTVVSVQWDSVPDAFAYKLERAESANGPWQTLADRIESRAFLDAKLPNGKTYFYRASAYGAPASSALSSVVSAAPDAKLPLKINVGGEAAGDWAGDVYGRRNGKNVSEVRRTGAAIQNLGEVPPQVYASRRENALQYVLPGQTPGARFKVRLHFFEPNSGLVNWRRFHASVGGQRVLSDFQLGREAGGKTNVAVVKEFETRADERGEVSVTLDNGSGNERTPLLAGLEFWPL